MPRIMGVNTPESFANLPWYERMNPFGSFVPAEERAARADGMLQMGLGILANNQGNYGSFLPALSRGGMMGMQAYQQALEKQSDKKRRGLQDTFLRSQISETTAQAQQRQAKIAEELRIRQARENLFRQADAEFAPESSAKLEAPGVSAPGQITANRNVISSELPWRMSPPALREIAVRALQIGDEDTANNLMKQADSIEKMKTSGLSFIKGEDGTVLLGDLNKGTVKSVFGEETKPAPKTRPGMPYQSWDAKQGKWITDPDAKRMYEESQRSGASSVNVDTKAEQAGMVEMAKLDAKAVNDLREKRSAASMTLPILKRLEKATADGKTYSGTFAEFKTGMGRLLDSIGIKGVNIDKVSSSEQYAADIAELVRTKIKALGSGSAISNTDLLFTQRSMPELLKTPEGRMAIIRAMRADLTSVVEDADAADAYFRENRGNLGGFKSPSSKRMESGSEVDDIVKKYLGR